MVSALFFNSLGELLLKMVSISLLRLYKVNSRSSSFLISCLELGLIARMIIVRLPHCQQQATIYTDQGPTCYVITISFILLFGPSLSYNSSPIQSFFSINVSTGSHEKKNKNHSKEKNQMKFIPFQAKCFFAWASLLPQSSAPTTDIPSRLFSNENRNIQFSLLPYLLVACLVSRTV
jgi:hypothetical protein